MDNVDEVRNPRHLNSQSHTKWKDILVNSLHYTLINQQREMDRLPEDVRARLAELELELSEGNLNSF